MSDPMESAGLINVRVSTGMAQNSGNCKIRPAMRYSDDGISWDTPKELVASYITSESTVYGTDYIDITAQGATVRAYIQFGVQAANNSGSAIEHCNATIRVEPKETIH